MEEITLPTVLPDPGSRVVLGLVGLVLLLAGRKVFWLALGAAGFLAGLYVASLVPVEGSRWVSLAVAVGCGLLGVLVALFVQKLAVGLAGFLVGGVGAVWLAAALALPVAGWEWAVFLAGGVLGAVLAGLLFKAALVVVSTVLGAGLLLEAARLDQGALAVGLFVLLVAVGLAVQSRGGAHSRRLRTS